MIKSKRRLFIVMLVMLIAIVVVAKTAKPQSGATKLGVWTQEVLSPLTSATSFVATTMHSGIVFITQLFHVYQVNKTLTMQVYKLQSEVAALQYAKIENNHLKHLLSLQSSKQSTHPLAASIIVRSSSQFLNTATLNRGTNQGVRLGNPVIAGAGAVGRIVAVAPTTSTVLFLTDPASGVGTLDAKSGDFGILFGGLSAHNNLTVKWYSHQITVSKGDTLVTSGLGGTFPKGTPIGKVVRTYATNFGMVHYAKVRPFVHFAQLQNVLILLR